MARFLGLFGLGVGVGASMPLQAIEFTKYPGYQGNLAVTGTVGVGLVNKDFVTLYASLAGTDPMCNTSIGSFSGNQCGLHIHEGETCDDALGHHWNKDKIGNDDPWVPVRYLDGKLTQQIVKIGLSAGELKRTLVVHDHSSARIACAVLTSVVVPTAMLTVGNFSKYPGYTGALDVGGDVKVGHVAPDVQFVTFSLFNLDQRCKPEFTALPDNPNACGIHVHVGADCSDAGNHLYNNELVMEDPWVDIRYYVVRGKLTVDSNDLGRRSGHQVMKDLSATMKATTLIKPEGDDSDWHSDDHHHLPEGDDDDWHSDDHHHLLEGDDDDWHSDDHHWALCTDGDDCSALSSGTTHAFQTGQQQDSLYSRTFVVHDASGKRIACAVTPAPPPDSSAFSFTMGLPILAVLLATCC